MAPLLARIRLRVNFCNKLFNRTADTKATAVTGGGFGDKPYFAFCARARAGYEKICVRRKISRKIDPINKATIIALNACMIRRQSGLQAVQFACCKL